MKEEEEIFGKADSKKWGRHKSLFLKSMEKEKLRQNQKETGDIGVNTGMHAENNKQ